MARLTPEQERIAAKRAANLEDGQTMVGFDGQPEPEQAKSMEDIRRETEAALGPRPQPGRLSGPPDAAPIDLTPDDEDEEFSVEDVAAAFPAPPVELQAMRNARETSMIPPRPATGDDDDPEQASYLPPDIPDGHIGAPTADQFANATWLAGRAQDRELVAEVLDYEELSRLDGVPYEVVWFRNGSPTYPWRDLDGERTPQIAAVKIVDPIMRWWAASNEVLQMPSYFVGLYYRHFEALREEGMYYHREHVKMAVHIALSSLDADEGILSKRGPDVVVQSVDTVKRWGIWTQGLRRLHRPMLALPEAGE